MIYIAVIGVDQTEPEAGYGAEETQCFVKAMYFSMFMWPQGPAPDVIGNTIVYMIHNRFHFISPMAGWILYRPTLVNRLPSFIVAEAMITYLYIPAIGIMFL